MADRNEDTPRKESDPLSDLIYHLRGLPSTRLLEITRFVQRKDAEVRHYQEANTAGPQTGPTPGGLGPSGLTEENVEEAFRYHPWDPDQARAGMLVVEALVGAAKSVLRNVPPCPDRSTALRKLREARMDANSAITHRGRF